MSFGVSNQIKNGGCYDPVNCILNGWKLKIENHCFNFNRISEKSSPLFGKTSLPICGWMCYFCYEIQSYNWQGARAKQLVLFSEHLQ